MTVIELPWGKWHPETQRRVEFPAGWEVEVLEPIFPPAMGREQIAARVREAVSTLPTGFRRACIVVEDPARPARLSELLAELIALLDDRSPNCEISVLVATGCHLWEDERPFQAKYGSFSGSRIRLHVHTVTDEMVEVGLKFGPVPVRLNRLFVESDCRILVGSVVPHPFAGFSGGAKTVLPGIADQACTEYSHKMVRLGGNLGDDPDKNRFRQLIERVVSELNIALTLCLVPTPQGAISAIHAGKVLDTYRSAVGLARQCYYVRVSRPFDLLVLNAYPKDMDLVQSRAALACLPRKPDSVLKPGGKIVLTTCSMYGSRGHGLFSPGGALYSPPRPDPRTANHDLLIFTKAAPDEVHAVFPPQYAVTKSWEELLHRVCPPAKGEHRVAVLPYAPLTRLV